MQLLARLRGLLAPPEFPDEEESRIASIIQGMGLVLVPALTAQALVIWFLRPDPRPRTLVTVAMIVAVVSSLVPLRFGRAKVSAWVLVIGGWAVLAIGFFVTVGTASPVISSFLVPIVIAGLLLGPRGAVVLSVLAVSVFPVFTLFGAEMQTPPNWGPSMTLGMWLMQSSVYIGIAAIVSIAAHQANRSRARERESAARFRAIADHAPDMILELGPDARVIYGNASAIAGAGRATLAEFRNESLDAWMHPDDAPRVMSQLRTLAENGGADRAVFRTFGANGKPGFLEATAAAYVDAKGRRRVVTVARDVTEQRRTEAALRESEERYRLLAENAPDMIREFDASGEIVFANRRVYEMLGIDVEEYRSRRRFDLIHPDDREQCERRFTQTALDGVPRYLLYRSILPDGGVVWLGSSVVRYSNAKGEVRLIVQSRDLTEERSLQEQLRQAQKMEAIGRLAGGVAHDFNNLLTVIGGYAAVLETSLGPGEAATAAHEISEATTRAAALTRQLLALSRHKIAQPGIVDLNAAIRGLEAILRGSLPERIGIELTLDPALPAIEIDPAQLDQMLLNLTLNARDAMPEHGTLRIETRCDPSGRLVHLCVSDTGHGMDEATRARAFEPFFTTKPPGEGTGIGLSMVYGIVRQSGGSISLESAPGLGTRVEASFPASESRAEIPARPTVPRSGPAGPGASVLLVEDDASVRGLLAIMLRNFGHVVTPASSAEEALELVERSQTKFDVLISDYMMPGQTGLELSRGLRERWPDLYVVLMTGYAEIPSTGATSLPGGARVLAKPFTREELRRAISRLIEPD